jgi:hypothetical protein
MGEEVLSKLIEFIESASPVVWTAAQQQVQANIIETAIWLGILGVLFLVCLVTSVYCIHRIRQQRYHEDWTLGAGFAIAGTVLLFLATGGLLAGLLTIHSGMRLRY